MPIYDESNFVRSAVPTYLKKDVREVIETAVMFGWKMHISGSNSVTIVSYDERKKYHFSATGRSSNSLNRIKRDVIRYGEPDKLLIADSILGMKDVELAQLATSLLPAVGQEGTVVDHRPELEAEKAEAERKKAEQRPTPAAMPKKAERSQCERTIVKQGPMLAKASDGKGYDSNAITQREWSDGSIDYKCNDCDYTSPNRLSVRGHISSHRKGPRPMPDRFPAEVPNAASYKPNKNRVAALAAVIDELMREGEMDPQTLALHALTWVHEQSRKGTTLAEEREPMGPEDVLNRIRALLDDGTQMEALREQDEKIAALSVRAEQAEVYAADLQEKLQAAEEKAEKAAQTLNTFIELATELRAEKVTE